MQNGEQSSDTLWARINPAAIRPKDELYRLYGENQFKDLVIDKFKDPVLYEFIEETKTRGPKFANYSPERLKEFVDRIYELRKNNSNYTPG